MMLVDASGYWHDERGLGAGLGRSFDDGYVSFREQPGSVPVYLGSTMEHMR